MAEDITANPDETIPTSIPEHIRTYHFPVSGYIPGIPGIWTGGSIVTVNEETKEIISIWPEPTPLPPALLNEPVQEPPAQPIESQTPAQGEALPVSLEDAMRMMGGTS